MTRRNGDFAFRGVHTVNASNVARPIATASLRNLRCVGCRAIGVTLITLGTDSLLGWANQRCYCTIGCALENGYRLPPSEPPAAGRRRRR